MDKMEFKNILEQEKELYLGNDSRQIRQKRKSYHKRYVIWKYLYYFRSCQYWSKVRQEKELGRVGRQIAKMRFRYYNRQRNLFSEKAGVEIGVTCKIGKNCDIWHSGVVINGNIGDDCTFHGNNIVGNKGKDHEKEVPVLGNKVDVGAGAIIIGGLEIANECTVGAGSVVTKSFLEEGTVIVGVPGKELH